MVQRAVRARIAGGINILLGLWLMASPWVFDYSGRSAVLNGVSVGALIAVLAGLRLTSFLRYSASVGGICLLLGFWTVVSPWTSGYVENKPALANDIMVGVLVIALAIWSGRDTEAKQPPGRPGY